MISSICWWGFWWANIENHLQFVISTRQSPQITSQNTVHLRRLQVEVALIVTSSLVPSREAVVPFLLYNPVYKPRFKPSTSQHQDGQYMEVSMDFVTCLLSLTEAGVDSKPQETRKRWLGRIAAAKEASLANAAAAGLFRRVKGFSRQTRFSWLMSFQQRSINSMWKATVT